MTEVLKVDDLSIIKAADLLRTGELVAFPTETVYGLGGDGLNPKSIKKIFEAKNRPMDNPLILHVYDEKDIWDIALEIYPKYEVLIEKYMPGPLTLVVKSKDFVPLEVRANLDTVAVRMPDNSDARRLIKAFQGPIAAPSANLSGRPSPTTAQVVLEDLNGKIPLILDGGATEIGIESTVLDISGESPIILRPGKITLEELQIIYPDIKSEDTSESPRAPGMKYRHYAPIAPIVIFKGEYFDVREKILREAELALTQDKHPGIICFDDDLEYFKGYTKLSIGRRTFMEENSSKIFSVLRDMDSLGVDIIYSVSVEEKMIGRAIMNRLIKASGGNIIEV